MHKRLHLRIYGRVQGVAYRAYTQDQARELGLTGWVRNRRDGSVELEAEGSPEALQRLLDWCFKGAPAARVESIEDTWGEASGEHTDFVVAPTN